MSNTVTLGGDRLGSGNKNKVTMKGYERSSHNQDFIWRSTVSAGTLVPFLTNIGTAGTSFDIGLDCDVLTHPTIAPLFGSFKVQLDVFSIPIRLYQASLHMNKLGIGMDMKSIKLPLMTIEGPSLRPETGDIDNAQVHSSALMKYLGIRGLGNNGTADYVQRRFSAIHYLGYFDIFKQYYSNKQEDNAYIIHSTLQGSTTVITSTVVGDQVEGTNTIPITLTNRIQQTYMIVTGSTDIQLFEPERLKITLEYDGTERVYDGDELFQTWGSEGITWVGTDFLNPMNASLGRPITWKAWSYDTEINQGVLGQPNLVPFELKQIDKMRELILQAPQDGTPFLISQYSIEPYKLPFYQFEDTSAGKTYFSMGANQEGLLVKTYQSDIYNNWVSTEWLDGVGGVNEISKVVTDAEGNFTIDDLNLASKIYKMLMRIAVSGGTYDDWQKSVFDHESFHRAESPVYHGGLIKELGFQSVVSNSEAGEAPLGTLAGRGQLAGKHKGGRVKIKLNEASVVLGIFSLTPRIDYSTGNSWINLLQTMDDLHKPQLDRIGFQELITDQMHFADTITDNAGGSYQEPTYSSAGKQPAWLNYMTNVNQIYGNFAVQGDQMYMTLTRRYEIDVDETKSGIRDLTTYIDPMKFNHIFADTRRDAQNFWVQIKVDQTARRKMSAKLMPNL